MSELTTTASQMPATAEQPSLLNFVALAVSDPNVDVAKLEALLRMQREIVSDDARSQFNAALHAAQMEMPRVAKNGVIDMGGKGKMPFATWEDVDTALRPIMQRHGFSLSFDMKWKEGGGGIVEGTLLHAAGHSKTVGIPLPSDQGAGRNNLQAMGSTLSYGKRYCAEMLFNIVRAGADDDGKAGGDRVITEAQKEEIIGLLQETGTDVRRFLATLGDIPTVDDMDQAVFPVALNLLHQKRAAAARKGGAS